MNPKVSVVIPYYNDKKYIAETLESVSQQTYQNIEIILVDDGSTDEESVRVFNSIQLKDGEKLHEKNAGPSKARNLGISHASGKYILPLDADDKIAPSYIEKAVVVLEKNPQCGIVYCKGRFFGEVEGKWKLPSFTMGKMLLQNIIFNAGLFRKEHWVECGGYDENLKVGIEDWDFWLSMLELNITVYQIPEELFFYRIKPVSRNLSFYKKQNLVKESYLLVQHKHRALYEKFLDEYLSESRKYILEQDFKIQSTLTMRIKAYIRNNFPIVRKVWHKWKNE